MELTDALESGDLRWLCPDGETQVTIECVAQVMEDFFDVARSIPQKRVQQRTVEQIDDASVPQVVEGMLEVVQIITQERISERIID